MEVWARLQMTFCWYMLLCVVCLCQEASGLRCYSCHYKNLLDQCLQNETTCGYGETCLNVVYRRPLLGIVYSKGCQDRSQCHSVQNVNLNRLCDTTPSECVYCCDDDLCNDANSLVTSYPRVTVFVMCVLWTNRMQLL